MSQHASEACNESNGTWLPLIEYSVKSGISLSTIRRKIKSNSIPYRLENGRYLILFQEKGISDVRSNQLTATANLNLAKNPERPAPRPQVPVERRMPVVNVNETDGDESVHMLVDAFEHALREKDERIQLLEKLVADLDERINELRLLVRVLEEKYEVRY
jgi:hypothetical protein